MDISNEQLLEAYDRVPRPIRAFIADSELPPIVSELGNKYGLHVDTMGILGELITKTLLGFVRPDVLPGMLTAQLHIPETTTSSLLADINERVFIPLQKRVREAAEQEEKDRALERELEESAPPDTAPIETPSKPEPLPPPALEYAPPATQAATLPGSPVAAPMPAAPAPTAPAQTEPTLVPTTYAPASHAVVPQQHVVHAPANHQPGWHPAAAVHIFVPTQPTQPHTAPVPHEVPQQAPIQPEPPIQAPPEPAPQPRPQMPSPPPAPAPAPRTFSQDPYREPI